MRLGAYPCHLHEASLAYQAYGTEMISERHRHRYEFNAKYAADFLAKGARITGTSPDGSLCEVIEVTQHPWMLGAQFHPEFKSKPTDPHPLFVAFLQASYDHARMQGKI